jgi:hypothetical protein
MDGLECTEILFSQLNAEFRIDAEYFYKSNLHMQALIKSKTHVSIGDIGVVTDGIHTSIDYDENSGINLISATSPRQNVFNLTRNAYISEIAHNANPRTALREKDVVLSTVGTIGNCAVVDKSMLPANSDRHVGIIRLNSTIKPYVLSTFLLTKYGRNQTVRETTGNVQPNLFLYKIREIIIPTFEDEFQETVQNTVLKAQELLKKSDDAYQQAEQLLEKEIGISMSIITNGGISVKSFSESFGSTGRLDAEYYQPKYDAIFSQIKSYKKGYLKLMDIVTDYSTGFAFSSDLYSNKGIPLVRITNISQGRLDLSNVQKIPYESIASTFKDYAKENDILISMSGSIGLSCIIPANTKVVVNQRIMRITQTTFNSNVLSMLINSCIVNEQLLRIGTGGVQTNISATDIGNVIIPKLDSKPENEIADLITNSTALKNNAETLLEYAKNAIEMAIEKNENTAIAWLNTKIDELTKGD